MFENWGNQNDIKDCKMLFLELGSILLRFNFILFVIVVIGKLGILSKNSSIPSLAYCSFL